MIMVCGDASTSSTAPTINTPSGWVEQVQFATAAAVSRSSIAVFTRVHNGAEPSTYPFTSSAGTSPKIGYIFSFRGLSTITANAVATSEGTSSSPVAPAVTPTDPNSFIMRICGFDDIAKIPSTRGHAYPKEVVGWRMQGTSGSGSNGMGLCVGGEHYNDTLAPSRTFTMSSSDEWGTCSIAFTVDYNSGIEGFPCKDLSNFKGHGQPQERAVLGGPDPLRIGGC